MPENETDTARPKRRAPAAWLAAMRRVSFQPGKPGKIMCSAPKRDGNPCGNLAVKGSRACQHHGGGRVRHRLRTMRPRCCAQTVDGAQCEHVAMEGSQYDRKPNRDGLCARHARRLAEGLPVTRMHAGQRVPYMRAPATRGSASAHGNARTYMSEAPPPELRATEAWRRASTLAQRAALLRAWEQRETSPALWRQAVRLAMAGEEGNQTHE